MDSAYRPSIDVFFRSIERYWRGDVVGALLTGMGKDGAGGLKALRNAGHHTIVQDRATSAVYGMPKAAAELKAATEILPIHLIGPRMLALVVSQYFMSSPKHSRPPTRRRGFFPVTAGLPCHGAARG